MIDGVVSDVKCHSYKSDGAWVNVYYPVMSYNVDGVEYKEISVYGFENIDNFKIADIKKVMVNPSNCSEFLLFDDEHYIEIEDKYLNVMVILFYFCLALVFCFYTTFIMG